MSNRGDWIQTFSGRQFFPLDPRPEDIFFDDIAHGLSLLCRFGGQCERFYSVAEHSYHVSTQVALESAKWGLLHDAAEAYIGDMLRPTKRMLPDYRKIEQRIQEAIAIRFGLDPVMPNAVAIADQRILMDEKAILMKTPPVEWDTEISGFGVRIIGVSSKFAEMLFRQRAVEVGLT